MKKLYITFYLVFFGLLGCSQEDTSNQTPKTTTNSSNIPQYQFAIHPLHNPTRLFSTFNPLIMYLNKHIPQVHFTLEASRDYATFDNKLTSHSVDFALPNPYQTLMAVQHNYHVIAKMGDDENFKGIILVRKDSTIKNPSDLKGKIISFPAPTALAATIMPLYYLHNHGLDVNNDIQQKYVGSQESSIMNVFLGLTAAGATWPPPWEALTAENPEIKNQVKVMWQTQPLPNNSIVVSNRVPKEIAQKVQKLLVTLDQSAEGREILKNMYLSKFEVANNNTYDRVQEFITLFEKTVRPL